MTLSRYDLFHAHIFFHAGELGLLFHAKEFPAMCPDFPYSLGFCQDGSDLVYTSEAMAWRNILWFKVQRSSPACRSRIADAVSLHEWKYRLSLRT